MKNSNTNLVSLNLKVLGNKDSQKGTCIFIHGLGDSHESFMETANELSSLGYRCILVDLPGCGINKEVQISFDECISSLKQIILENIEDKNFFFGHSLGGLLLLFILSELGAVGSKGEIFTVEPSITTVDLKFFEYVQPEPKGVGYSGLIKDLSLGEMKGYMPKYLRNLKSSNKQMFEIFVGSVVSNFENMVSQIYKSNIQFTYIFGALSDGANVRKKVGDNKNVRVKALDDAQHWAHIDNHVDFFRVIELMD